MRPHALRPSGVIRLALIFSSQALKPLSSSESNPGIAATRQAWQFCRQCETEDLTSRHIEIEKNDGLFQVATRQVRQCAHFAAVRQKILTSQHIEIGKIAAFFKCHVPVL